VIGLLGGSFDPPHNGHVALAYAAVEQLPIDRLVVLVAERPGHREPPTVDADTRLKLARAAFPDADVELETHPFTVDAVRGSRFDDAVFILGADQAVAFGTWKEPEEVLKHVKLGVGTRAGYPQPDLGRYGDRVLRFELDSPDISSSEVRKRVAAGETIDDLVPPAVARLIEELELYR
jgi:nicotinate-nucleotide adenylyltransferase